MIRKLLFAVLLLSVGFVNAQSVGEWKLWPRFANSIDRIVETPSKVYFTSANRLFHYDKQNNETFGYTTQNKLNDTSVSLISYNPEGKYLFIAYDTGNIDILFENGHVVNVSDIKDANITGGRRINNVIFSNGRIYIAANFGILVLDDKKFEVVESGIYGKPVNAVIPVSDFLFLENDDGWYYSLLSNRHNTLDKFTASHLWFYPQWVDVVGDNIVLQEIFGNQELRVINIRNNDGRPQIDIDEHGYAANGPLNKTATKNYISTASEIVFINEDRSVETVALPAPLKGQKIALDKGVESVWAGDKDGIANYSIGNDGTVSVLSDKSKPEGIYTDWVHVIRFDNWGNVWTGNVAPTNYRRDAFSDYYFEAQATTRIVDGVPEDVNFLVQTPAHNQTKEAQRKMGDKRLYGCVEFVPDPEIPDRYYQCTNMDGLYIAEKDPESGEWNWVGRYTQTNAPFIGGEGWGARTFAVNFDKEGNLWVAISGDESLTTSCMFVLPRNVLRSKAPDQYEKSDWIPTKHFKENLNLNKDAKFLICEKSDVIIDFSALWQSYMTVNKTKGTLTNTADDEIFSFVDPVDQDGNIWNPVFITCAVEDKNGKVWIGSSELGIIEIANPEQLSRNTRVTRLKVPRNDGTNFADYLCGADLIYEIAVDHSNRKWIATQTSGVYLVSENGDKILEHFTTDNSPLPSNRVLSVACDPNSNTVYFGLESGLVSYNSTSSPSFEDFSEVYAYPNPVRPDYTGYITITGLMENSLVKICDAANNVVFQTRSEGGSAIWDGMDSSHNRVKSGVYYVLASQNPNGGAEGVVTKIMVIH